MSNNPEHSTYFKELNRKLKELKISADNGESIVPNDDDLYYDVRTKTMESK